MRRFVPFVLIALSAAAPLSASPTEGEAAVPLPEPAVAAPALVEEAPTAPELRLDEVRVEQSEVADDADTGQLPARGSFWWLVGVIVVAGVILALLL